MIRQGCCDPLSKWSKNRIRNTESQKTEIQNTKSQNTRSKNTEDQNAEIKNPEDQNTESYQLDVETYKMLIIWFLTELEHIHSNEMKDSLVFFEYAGWGPVYSNKIHNILNFIRVYRVLPCIFE